MPSKRKPSIDALRGLVMVLMVLDHAREFFSPTPFVPTDASLTTPAWFFTRWVTHFCAPGFVFLAGTAAWFKGKTISRNELSRWLVRRGLWVVLVEVFLNNVLWFSSAWGTIGFFVQLQVLWAIGVSMICLGGLCRLPLMWTGFVAAAMILGHNLLDGVPAAPLGQQGAGDIIWALFHHSTLALLGEGGQFGLVYLHYPLVPWIGVLAAGWIFGAWFDGRAVSPRALVWLGLGLSAAFVLLRYTNAYGDPRPWHVSDRGNLYTLLDFLNCEKYPPSLAFLLMTLGPAMIVLAVFERLPERTLRPLLAFGRVPMFFYLLHVAVIHAAAVAFALYVGRPLGWWWNASIVAPDGYKPSLGVCYLVWALVVAGLYLPCIAWGRVKARRRHGWVSLF